jgi:hypothetical protein
MKKKVIKIACKVFDEMGDRKKKFVLRIWVQNLEETKLSEFHGRNRKLKIIVLKIKVKKFVVEKWKLWSLCVIEFIDTWRKLKNGESELTDRPLLFLREREALGVGQRASGTQQCSYIYYYIIWCIILYNIGVISKLVI